MSNFYSRNFYLGKTFILLVVGGISWILLKEIFTYLDYSKGKEAYQSAQCQEAIAFCVNFF